MKYHIEQKIKYNYELSENIIFSVFYAIYAFHILCNFL